MDEKVEEVTFEQKITIFKRVRTLYETVKKVVDNIITSSPKENNTTISTPESVIPNTEDSKEEEPIQKEPEQEDFKDTKEPEQKDFKEPEKQEPEQEDFKEPEKQEPEQEDFNEPEKQEPEQEEKLINISTPESVTSPTENITSNEESPLTNS